MSFARLTASTASIPPEMMSSVFAIRNRSGSSEILPATGNIAFAFDGTLGRVRDVRRGQTELLRQLIRLAGGAEHVLDADEFDRAGGHRRERLADRAAKPAVNIVIFRGDESAGLDGTTDQQ